MTTTSAPKRHWRSAGTEPLPSGAEAMGEPFAAFPSWFLRIECDRCGKVQIGQRFSPHGVRPPVPIAPASPARGGCATDRRE
jgi:hypothetical protein